MVNFDRHLTYYGPTPSIDDDKWILSLDQTQIVFMWNVSKLERESCR